MRILPLFVMLQSLACVAVEVDIDEVCSEHQLAFLAPAMTAAAKVDLSLTPETKLGSLQTMLELDSAAAVTEMETTVIGKGETQPVTHRWTLTDAERASGRIDLTPHLDLLERLQRGEVQIAYRVTAPGASTLTGRARTCASSSTRIERKAY